MNVGGDGDLKLHAGGFKISPIVACPLTEQSVSSEKGRCFKMKRASTAENEFPFKKDNKLEKMQGSTG